jgi:hypothetical protein
MKMQLITIRPNKSGIENGFRIKRELFDECEVVDMAFCSIRTTKNGFAASGFSSIHKPTIIHDVSNSSESIDDFIKAVFSK